MFKVGNKVVRNTALSDDEIMKFINVDEMYPATIQELLNEIPFEVLTNGREKVCVKTQRGTNVMIPTAILQLFSNALEEGEEL